MNWFPQVGTGAVAQFPLQRKRQWRAITNLMESGELISLPDPNGGQIEWRLSYQDLTDTEVANLTSLFAASNGEAIPFGFVDPFANLLGWSENLTQPGWQPGLLTLWERSAHGLCEIRHPASRCCLRPSVSRAVTRPVSAFTSGANRRERLEF